MQLDLAGGGRQQAVDDLEERRFPAAARAEEADEGAVGNVEELKISAYFSNPTNSALPWTKARIV